MATYNKFNAFVEALAHGKHNLATASDTLRIALTNAANAPIATNSVLANLTQIASYANINDNMQLTISDSAHAAGTFTLKITDKTFSATGTVPAFKYIVIYNDTAINDDLICWYDYGSEVVLNNGDSFTVDFDGVDGVFTIV